MLEVGPGDVGGDEGADVEVVEDAMDEVLGQAVGELALLLMWTFQRRASARGETFRRSPRRSDLRDASPRGLPDGASHFAPTPAAFENSLATRDAFHGNPPIPGRRDGKDSTLEASSITGAHPCGRAVADMPCGVLAASPRGGPGGVHHGGGDAAVPRAV